MGNLGDRIVRAPGLFRGYVVDWIGVGPLITDLKLADSAIVCGCILHGHPRPGGFHLDRPRASVTETGTSPRKPETSPRVRGPG